MDVTHLVRRLQGVPPVMFSGGLKEIPEFVMEEEKPVILKLACKGQNPPEIILRVKPGLIS